MEERERDRSDKDRSFTRLRDTVDRTPCTGVREIGNDGGIALPVAQELAGGERVSAGGERW